MRLYVIHRWWWWWWRLQLKSKEIVKEKYNPQNPIIPDFLKTQSKTFLLQFHYWNCWRHFAKTTIKILKLLLCKFRSYFNMLAHFYSTFKNFRQQKKVLYGPFGPKTFIACKCTHTKCIVFFIHYIYKYICRLVYSVWYYIL